MPVHPRRRRSAREFYDEMVRSGQIEPPPPQSVPGSLVLADADSVGAILFRCGMRTENDVAYSLQIPIYQAKLLCGRRASAGRLKATDAALLRKLSEIASERLAAYAVLRQACSSALTADEDDALMAKLKGRIR